MVELGGYKVNQKKAKKLRKAVYGDKALSSQEIRMQEKVHCGNLLAFAEGEKGIKKTIIIPTFTIKNNGLRRQYQLAK